MIDIPAVDGGGTDGDELRDVVEGQAPGEAGGEDHEAARGLGVGVDAGRMDGAILPAADTEDLDGVVADFYEPGGAGGEVSGGLRGIAVPAYPGGLAMGAS